MAESIPEFGGADILYVADANEVDPPAVARFKEAGLRCVVVQKSSPKTAFGLAPYVVFPSIPQAVRHHYMAGTQPLGQLMKSALLGAQLMFEKEVARFLKDLMDAMDG